VKDKFSFNNLALKFCVILVTIRGIMLVARYCISCTCARPQGTLATHSSCFGNVLTLRETSSSFGICVTCGQGDHVIALHSIVSLGMSGE
jgi:hypothetical protein